MPAIHNVQLHENRPELIRDRIQELKARATEGLDDALNIVAKNLLREEAKAAENSLAGLGEELAIQQEAAHSLDMTKVMDLISDPFEDE